jgi:ABC-type transport system involved in cytochrome bd biosynthesis fused ATPase/permease subunit
MKINKTVKIILIIMIPSIVIVNALIVWLSLEGQKEKIKEFLYLKNLNKTLLDLKSGKITLLQYCSQVPASAYDQERICSKYNKSY